MTRMPPATVRPHVTVRALTEQDLAQADRVMRVAFGTFIGLPDPAAFLGDADYVFTRWRTSPSAAFAAETGGRFAGSNFATRWGSVGFFGPLSVHPDFWDQGIAKRLMEPVIGCFEAWDTRSAGLFTFANSARHLGLYQHFGFWPRFLTAVMSKSVGQPPATSTWTRLSRLGELEQAQMLARCRALTDAVHEGLDVGIEIGAVAEQRLGDTVVLLQEGEVSGFAVCHYGPGTEAGSNVCYVKFAAARPEPQAEECFARLLDACEALAAEEGLGRLCAGVSTARHEAYRCLLARGFRTDLQGVVMQRQNETGYNRPGVFVIDDWR